MSSLHMKPLAKDSPSAAIARYYQADYSLVVSPNGQVPIEAFYASIDSHTLLFETSTLTLIGIDAYTNWELWSRHQLTLPLADITSTLKCLETFDQNGIGPSPSIKLNYAFSEIDNLLQIKLGNAQVKTWVKCLSCVTCGLSSNEELLEVWIQGLEII